MNAPYCVASDVWSKASSRQVFLYVDNLGTVLGPISARLDSGECVRKRRAILNPSHPQKCIANGIVVRMQGALDWVSGAL